MGAFAIENVRSSLEAGARKIYVVARRHNILLPRVLSWYANQSSIPPPAACILRAMEPMYKYYGKDPWSYPAVSSTADRRIASIKQYTRWAIQDVYFLAVFYGRAETVEGEVKLFRSRSAVVSTGRVIENVDYCIKCLGFGSDLGADRLMKTTFHLGFWPEGDYRRWVASDQSGIDASRFGGTSISSFAASLSYWSTHFFRFPEDAKRILEMRLLAKNMARPEQVAAAYHYEPRAAAIVITIMATATPQIADWENSTSPFRKDSMWSVAPPDKFLEECEKEWFFYGKLFRSHEDMEPCPPYPYSLQFVYGLLAEEKEDNLKHLVKAGLLSQDGLANELAHVRATGRSIASTITQSSAALSGMSQNEATHLAQWQKKQALRDRAIAVLARQGVTITGDVVPGSKESFLPMRQVLQEKGRHGGNDQRGAWLAHGNAIRDALIRCPG